MAKYTTQTGMNAFKILKRNGNGDRDTRTLHGSGFYPAISEHLTPAFVGLLGKFSHFHAPSLLNHIYIYIYIVHFHVVFLMPCSEALLWSMDYSTMPPRLSLH